MNKLNGWQRLWVMIVILTGIGLVYYTETKVIPDIDKVIKVQWIQQGSEILAEQFNEDKRTSMNAREFRYQVLYPNFKTQEEAISWFEELATGKHKTEITEERSQELQFTNDFYKEELNNPNKKYKYYIGVLVAWSVFALLLYLLGSMMGWVVRGFKK